MLQQQEKAKAAAAALAAVQNKLPPGATQYVDTLRVNYCVAMCTMISISDVIIQQTIVLTVSYCILTRNINTYLLLLYYLQLELNRYI